MTLENHGGKWLKSRFTHGINSQVTSSQQSSDVTRHLLETETKAESWNYSANQNAYLFIYERDYDSAKNMTMFVNKRATTLVRVLEKKLLAEMSGRGE